MKVNITTRTFNRECLLSRTIESVLSQTFTDFEYIIINNGSTDETQNLIDSYCKQDKRIHTIRFPFNSIDTDILTERSKIKKKYMEEKNLIAPYYMRIDDDDYMEPNTIETLYRLITEYDADIASVGSRFVYPDGSMKDKFIFEGIYVFNRIDAMIEMLKREKFNASSGGKLFRRGKFDEIEHPKVKELRDIYSRYRMIERIDRMVVSGEPLFYFYRHDSNVSGLETVEQITPVKMKQHLDANKMRTEWLSERMPEIKDFVFYCELSFMISLYERIHRLKVLPCYSIAKEMRKNVVNNLAYLTKCDFCTEREKEILKIMEKEYNY